MTKKEVLLELLLVEVLKMATYLAKLSDLELKED